ncbi:MAG: ATP-binding cassette domain-containing protein [Betaproteobacteria bacterium]|nr:ATP-binding cassette domain-containing protein [Betaproteobacteria bacterium]MBL0292563.1 ATP-binding cassette domain-containing protein [Betaproteobacteria bacterium]
MFALTGIDHRYGRTPVLAIDDWSAAAGEHWLLAGPSGSGKTTALHLLAGLCAPTAGRVSVGGVDLATLRGAALDRWRGRSVGLVPQRLHLVGALDVLDNLRLARYLAGLPDEPTRALLLLEAMGIDGLARRMPRQLSQGQAQRVAVARAVVNHPALLLADEPTANLDDAHAQATLLLLRAQAVHVGATLVVASHDARVRPLLPRVFTLPPRTVSA